jgi:hypothetical protein
MRVCARYGFPYRLVKMALLANDNGYDVDSNTPSCGGTTHHPCKMFFGANYELEKRWDL